MNKREKDQYLSTMQTRFSFAFMLKICIQCMKNLPTQQQQQQQKDIKFVYIRGELKI